MGETPGDDDATLVRRIAEDKDERALAELMARHAPKVTGDLRHRLLQANVPCAPCFRRACPIDFRCMTGITPEQVIESVLQVLTVQ